MPEKGWKHTNPSKPLNLTGQRFERLVALELMIGYKRPTWRCQCDCGKESVVSTSNLRGGKQKSCGCLNAEKRQARVEASRKSDEHKREVHRKHSANYDRKNRKKKALNYLTNREKRVKSAVEWGRKNKAKRRTAIMNHRAKRKLVEGKHTADDIVDLFLLQRGICPACREHLGEGFHVDHIVPTSRGGTNWRQNLQLLCKPCNIRKGVRSSEEFMQIMGFLL